MSEPVPVAGHVERAASHSLEQAYRTYRVPIERYLLRLCGSAEQAEELAQDVFLRALVSWVSFRGESTLATWLFRIARNAYLDSLRRPRSPRVDTDEFLAIPDASAASDPVRQLDSGEQRGLIQLALAQLPEKQRSVLLLRDEQGLAYAEIAEVLGMSLPAVKVNLFRARNAFRAAYAELTHTD